VGEEVPVPLSEEERKRLAELEQELATNDPELAQKLESGKVHFRPTVSSIAAGLAALVGMLLILVGISTQLIIVGVVGFVIMGAAVYWLLNRMRPRRRAQ
jgi:ABC-type multidrug transport system fused ATPase/permease subunit